MRRSRLMRMKEEEEEKETDDEDDDDDFRCDPTERGPALEAGADGPRRGGARLGRADGRARLGTGRHRGRRLGGTAGSAWLQARLGETQRCPWTARLNLVQ